MASQSAKRIMADKRELDKHPSHRYAAAPLEDNIFEWHFTIRGPVGSDFEGGIYHGRILLPPEYPMKPPNFIFLNDNGRFERGTKICLSISGYHEETWSPSWGIRTMLEAIISFFPSEGAGAIGALDWPKVDRQKCARESLSFKCPHCGLVNDLLSAIPPSSSSSATSVPSASVDVTTTSSGTVGTGETGGAGGGDDNSATILNEKKDRSNSIDPEILSQIKLIKVSKVESSNSNSNGDSVDSISNSNGHSYNSLNCNGQNGNSRSLATVSSDIKVGGAIILSQQDQINKSLHPGGQSISTGEAEGEASNSANKSIAVSKTSSGTSSNSEIKVNSEPAAASILALNQTDVDGSQQSSRSTSATSSTYLSSTSLSSSPAATISKDSNPHDATANNTTINANSSNSTITSSSSDSGIVAGEQDASLSRSSSSSRLSNAGTMPRSSSSSSISSSSNNNIPRPLFNPNANLANIVDNANNNVNNNNNIPHVANQNRDSLDIFLGLVIKVLTVVLILIILRKFERLLNDGGNMSGSGGGGGGVASSGGEEL